jgi:CubicO group peptidase (beta-lactamase class C family)
MMRPITAFARLLAGRSSISHEVTPIGFVARTGEFSEASKRDLDTLIRHELRSGIPGLTVAVLDDGKTVWSDGYGVADSVFRRAMTVNTRLEAASLGKPITTYASLRLVEAGKLDLRRPLSSYLREQFVRGDRESDQITAWNVLTHTSGLSNNLLESEHKVVFTPGSQFSYSGVGFMYLQRVIEEVSSAAFNDFLTESIFTPLGMTGSSYFRAARTAPRARGHAYLLGLALPMPFAPNVQPNAANLLCSTAPDLAKFVAELLDPTLVSRALVEQMLTPQISADQKSWWGLGIGLYRGPQSTGFWHWGDNLDFQSYLIGCRREKIGVVVMTNSSRGLGPARKIAARALEG